jgi:hypothetical protein
VSRRYVVEISPSALASPPRDETGRQLLRAVRALEVGLNQLDIEQADDRVWYYYPDDVQGYAILFTIAGGPNNVTGRHRDSSSPSPRRSDN